MSVQVNGQQFELQVDQWIAKAKGRAKEFCTEFIQDINQRVVEATPVKTGFLRGSWYAALGQGANDTGGATDPSGGSSVARMNLVASQLKLGDIYQANNGANYAVFVEFGTSKMAPRSFVRGTLDQAEEIANETLQRINSEST